MGRPKKKQVEEVLVEQAETTKVEEPKVVESKLDPKKKAVLMKLMNEVNTSFDDKDMLKFAINEPHKESIPYGIPDLDKFAGNGSVKGNVTITWGGEGCGKTTLAYYQIAETQKAGGIACLIDMEHSFDGERAKTFGVNLDELILIENCTHSEQAMNIVIKLAKEKVVDLIVLDSIQAMSSKAEQETKKGVERSMEEDEIAVLAKKMGKFLSRIAGFIYKGKTALLLIGQVRTGGIGTFITKDTLTGGRALGHWSVQTLYLRKGQGADAPTEKVMNEETGKKEDKKIGFDMVIKVEKTKKSGSQPELSEIHLPFLFKNGLNELR